MAKWWFEETFKKVASHKTFPIGKYNNQWVTECVCVCVCVFVCVCLFVHYRDSWGWFLENWVIHQHLDKFEYGKVKVSRQFFFFRKWLPFNNDEALHGNSRILKPITVLHYLVKATKYWITGSWSFDFRTSKKHTKKPGKCMAHQEIWTYQGSEMHH